MFYKLQLSENEMKAFEGIRISAERIKTSGRMPPCRNTREISVMAGVSYDVMTVMLKDNKLSPPESYKAAFGSKKAAWYSLPDVVKWLKSEIVIARIESYLIKANKKS